MEFGDKFQKDGKIIGYGYVVNAPTNFIVFSTRLEFGTPALPERTTGSPCPLKTHAVRWCTPLY